MNRPADQIFYQRHRQQKSGAANPLQIVENGQLWAVEDWDNDGDLDLLVERLVGDGQGYAFIYLEQLSDGSFREPRENPFHGLSSIESRCLVNSGLVSFRCFPLLRLLFLFFNLLFYPTCPSNRWSYRPEDTSGSPEITSPI